MTPPSSISYLKEQMKKQLTAGIFGLKGQHSGYIKPGNDVIQWQGLKTHRNSSLKIIFQHHVNESNR